MTSKLLRFCAATVFTLSTAALAQTGGNAAALPSAPGSAPPPVVAAGGGSKVGTVNIEQAIFASNEGQRDFDILGKKLEPKETELKGQKDEIDSLKKQLDTQGPKLNDDARGNLVKQIEDKQKRFERAGTDFREDMQAQQNEIAQRILQKMAPMMVKYASDNGYGILLDTSSPWPNGPVVWNNVEITKPIVDAYNAQSGVPAPVRTNPTKPSAGPAASRPAPTTTKPATTAPAPK
jgi:Skp family chaperone for outer membrane proteins